MPAIVSPKKIDGLGQLMGKGQAIGGMASGNPFSMASGGLGMMKKDESPGAEVEIGGSMRRKIDQMAAPKAPEFQPVQMPENPMQRKLVRTPRELEEQLLAQG